MVALLQPTPAAKNKLVLTESADAHWDAFSPRRLSLRGAERRMSHRREIQLRVEGRRMDHSIPARQQPQLSLHLRDLSEGGLAATVQTPLESGERVVVFFPPQGARRGWDAYGRVLRCEPKGDGYRVAVEFDAVPAAA